jgi:hypothetical protein
MSNFDDAQRWLRENGGPERAIRVFQRSGVGASSTLDSDLGDGAAIAAFSDSLRTTSAFFRGTALVARDEEILRLRLAGRPTRLVARQFNLTVDALRGVFRKSGFWGPGRVRAGGQAPVQDSLAASPQPSPVDRIMEALNRIARSHGSLTDGNGNGSAV